LLFWELERSDRFLLELKKNNFEQDGHHPFFFKLSNIRPALSLRRDYLAFALNPK
jgi:hypothetical protein